MFKRIHLIKYKEFFKVLFWPKKAINVDYEEAWKPELGIYDYIRTNAINGRPAIQSGLEIKRIHVAEIDKYIKFLKPKSVLEVGSGNGMNLEMLAELNPPISFRGIEPTKMGVSKSKFNRLGSVFDLKPNEADLVFIMGVLVLIPERDRALRKIYEATNKYAIFSESFEEHNTWVQRRRLKRKGTPCIALKDVRRYFNIFTFNPPMMDKFRSQESLFVGIKRARILA